MFNHIYSWVVLDSIQQIREVPCYNFLQGSVLSQYDKVYAHLVSAYVVNINLTRTWKCNHRGSKELEHGNVNKSYD